MTIPGSSTDDPARAGFAVSHPGEDVCVVEVGCELDMMTVPSLESLLTRALTGAHRTVLVALSGCDFIASAGLAAVVAARSQEQELGTRFGLVAVTRVVDRALRATGLEPLLTIYDSLDSALTDTGPRALNDPPDGS